LVNEVHFFKNFSRKNDISKFLFETVYLLIPPRNVHKENECNPEVISKLKHLLVKEKSKENPQWDILKKLKNK